MRSELRLNEVCGIPGLKFETWGTQLVWLRIIATAGPSTSLRLAQDDGLTERGNR